MGIYQKKAHILQNRFIAVVNVSVVIKRGGGSGSYVKFLDCIVGESGFKDLWGYTTLIRVGGVLCGCLGED